MKSRYLFDSHALLAFFQKEEGAEVEYPISYADCFALASALEHSAILVTGDPEFKKVRDLIEILWIR